MIRILHVVVFLLALLLAPPFMWAKEKKKKVERADKATIKAVRVVLKTPIEDLTSEIIQGFLAVDPLSLPRRMRMKYTSRVLELKVLRHIAKKNRRGYIRRISPDCEPDEGSKTSDLRILLQAGFVRISEDEESYVMRKTQCTEIDLVCEFSLQIGVEKLRGGKTKRHLFLHSKDPLLNIVGEYRAGHKGGQTKFFGRGAFKCKH